jgi:hypothetical protein
MGFRVDYYEVRVLFEKLWTANIFSRKFRGSFIKIYGPRALFLLNGRAFLQNDCFLPDPDRPRA